MAWAWLLSGQSSQSTAAWDAGFCKCWENVGKMGRPGQIHGIFFCETKVEKIVLALFSMNGFLVGLEVYYAAIN